jgi:hypothetical protein
MDEDTGSPGGAHPASPSDEAAIPQPSPDLPPGYVPYGAEPSARELQVDDHGSIPSPEAATAGYKPFEAEEQERDARVFPPEVADPLAGARDPEEREALDEELRR